MLSVDELIETVRLVNEGGIKLAAEKQFIVGWSVGYRIRRLEKLIGIKLYPDGDFGRMTYQGREWLKQHDKN